MAENTVQQQEMISLEESRDMTISTQQQSESASLTLVGESSSQQLGSQEVGNKPKPGKRGWLVANAENTGNTEKHEGISAKDSREMISASYGSEGAHKVKRGESGCLVRSWSI